MDGFDDLQKTLDDAQRAVESLERELGMLRVDPSNPQTAIAEMERTIDARLAQYRGNAIVEQLAEALKEQFRKGISQQAEEAKNNTSSEYGKSPMPGSVVVACKNEECDNTIQSGFVFNVEEWIERFIAKERTCSVCNLKAKYSRDDVEVAF
jgi:hypothetical protein